ncbi:helix-turn-helix domain-containing protein [Photobacterium leiognathi]|uniref:helix-turn-helix domain-containing protein n=1 Tax=Photobacterium leiognathi TaxID=553611 RepID=UPI00273474D2|nr:AraC family transcriptional regulator [Photobacterium leiognathi]
MLSTLANNVFFQHYLLTENAFFHSASKWNSNQNFSYKYESHIVNNYSYTTMSSLSFTEGFKVITLLGDSHKLFPNDYYMIIASYGSISWNSNSSEGKLSYGGAILINPTSELSLKFSDKKEKYLILIPKIFLNKNVYMINDVGVIDNPVIVDIALNISVSDEDLEYKINAIINLMKIKSLKKKVETRSEYELKKIYEFIEKNIMNNCLNLDLLSNQLFMSKSKIQKIFHDNGKKYNEVVKVLRVNLLAEKIKNNVNKTIIELCYESGFNSRTNADIQFKQVKNLTIKEYKNKLKNKAE